jgi:Putative redox-active protein (C_GCAxxG_C_C)
MSVVDGSFDHPLKIEEKASAPLAGGIMQQGYQCGMLWGAALAAGAQAYQRLGPGPDAEVEALVTAQRLVESFQARNKEINCSDIIQLEWKSTSQSKFQKQILKFFLRGGPINCFRMAADYAQAAYNEINTPLSGEPAEAHSGPVSCTAVLARQMGLSDLHAVMAAGLAGGIGLSGGACGALGAAIWILGMDSLQGGDGKIGFTPPGAEDALERFLESADYEFECSKIVGRMFANAADHADYLRAGGCSGIIEALAAQ